MTPDVRVLTDLDALSREAGHAAVEVLQDAVRRQGRCSLVLSGGTTPRTLYGVMASRAAEVPWDGVHVFWGDERYVPPDDPRSNYRMARETLLDRVPCPAANIHPMPTHFASPEEAARDYEQTLKSHVSLGSPAFDLVLLGLGEDGHTASLFPGSPALDERARWVVAVEGPSGPPARLTLTLPAFAGARVVYFLVAGASKCRALRETLASTDAKRHPAAGVRPEHGIVTWWVDRDAAGGQVAG